MVEKANKNDNRNCDISRKEPNEYGLADSKETSVVVPIREESSATAAVRKSMAENDRRIIEITFPVKEVSLDSVHEKNVRHGHISTLHIWPARRPLAACRAALIAMLLADPGDAEQRKAILERMAGRVVEKVERKRVSGRLVEKVKEETAGGILHWGREGTPICSGFGRDSKGIRRTRAEGVGSVRGGRCHSS